MSAARMLTPSSDTQLPRTSAEPKYEGQKGQDTVAGLVASFGAHCPAGDARMLQIRLLHCQRPRHATDNDPVGSTDRSDVRADRRVRRATGRAETVGEAGERRCT